jgi:hypothetical protein
VSTTRIAAGQQVDADGRAICTGLHRPLGTDAVVDCDEVATYEQDYTSVAGPVVRTYRCETHRVDGYHPDHRFTTYRAEGFALMAVSA